MFILGISMACATSPRPEPLPLPLSPPELAPLTLDDAVFQITYLLDSAEGFSLVAGTRLQLEVVKRSPPAGARSTRGCHWPELSSWLQPAQRWFQHRERKAGAIGLGDEHTDGL